ncbi:MAG TPA: hypothetical protein VN207_01035 [Ktedonobacteraceae bacterium]|nr:hypothetical protein [Ktedonobacteraceae bacterium]
MRGLRIDPEAPSLSPYITQHFVRFDPYQMDHTRLPASLTYEIAIPSPEEALVEASEVVSTNWRAALSEWPKFVRIVVASHRPTQKSLAPEISPLLPEGPVQLCITKLVGWLSQLQMDKVEIRFYSGSESAS